MNCFYARALVLLAFVFQDVPVYAAHLKAPSTSRSADYSWGQKRAVTEADRGRIAKYRSGKYKSSIWQHFSDPQSLHNDWILKSDDSSDLLSCRRPENVVITKDGLTLKTLVATDSKARWSTGSIWSQTRQKYGFFEARFEIADTPGINNAFWLTTDDGFEIDIAEARYPGSLNTTVHRWQPTPHNAVGFHSIFSDNLSTSFHDYSALWTPQELIFAIDGEPVSAVVTNGSIGGSADIRFSTAIAPFAGKVTEHPENHNMKVKYLHAYLLQD